MKTKLDESWRHFSQEAIVFTLSRNCGRLNTKNKMTCSFWTLKKNKTGTDKQTFANNPFLHVSSTITPDKPGYSPQITTTKSF